MTDTDPQTRAELDAALARGILDGAPDGIVVVDDEGTMLVVNQRAGELFGFPPADLVGRPVEVLLPEAVRDAHRAHRTRYRAEPRTRAMGSGLELWGRRADGTDVPVEVSLSPLDTGAGRRVIATIRDITARVHDEEERRRIRATLDATKDGVFIFDPDTLVFTYVNQGAAALTGYPRDELLTMTPMHLDPVLAEDDWRELLAPLRRDEVSARTLTTVHRTRDGRDVPVEVVVQFPEARPGLPRQLVAIVRDLSERVDAERALHEARQQLAVTEDRERIARDLHDTVIQRIFAAGMGLQATVARIDDADARARLERTIDELDETIREIRSAIFGLQAPPDGGPGLRGDVMRLVDELRPVLGFVPRVQFTGAVEGISPAVADQLLPVLREALTNVARHAGANQVRVAIEVDSEVVVRVADNGIGVPDDVIGGNGLPNLDDRAASLGGRCTVGRGDGGGTVVEWRVPAEP